LLGNPTAAAAVPSEISVGTGLSLSVGGVLSSANTGTVTTASVVTANGISGTVATATTTPAITLTLGAIIPTSVVATGVLSGTQLTSTIATGTAPFVVASTTAVANLSIGGNAATATTATSFTGSLAGDVSGTQGATAIGANKVTYAKIQTVTASSLLGNPTAAAAVPSEISVGTGLSLSVGGVLTATGGGAVAIAMKTATYTAIASDYTILCDATAAGFTLTLPAASGVTGSIYVIRKIDETANVLTFSPAIYSSVSSTFTTLNFSKTIRIQSNGTNWYQID
jgi:hypothetical protein